MSNNVYGGKTDKELAAIIARAIFEIGGERLDRSKVTRIQFMHGRNPERPGAGYGEKPLADFIETVLKQHRTY